MNLKSATMIFVVLVWSNLARCEDITDAAKSGDLEKVKALLKDNPDLVFSKNTNGTPLHVAARNGHKAVVELLLANKADVNAKTDISGWTPLHEAAFHGFKDVVELLLANNADVNAANVIGLTPLLFAAVYDRKDIAELLLQKNAAVDAKDRFGHAPLRVAMANGHIDMMELLLAYKADVNTRDQFGKTPLELATGTNVAKLLLANKADVNAKDNVNGWTPLHAAAFRKSKDLAVLLLASNAIVNPKDNRGDTPLHIAVQQGSKDLVELLLANKADVNATNNDGSTPLQFGFDEKDVAALLRQHGGHGKENKTTPLVGWYLDGDTDSQHDKAIIDDYEAYAHKVWPKDRDFFFSEINFFEDGTGRHAVRIELETGSRYYVEYYLLYNTNNVRTKVIKGKTWRQLHM